MLDEHLASSIQYLSSTSWLQLDYTYQAPFLSYSINRPSLRHIRDDKGHVSWPQNSEKSDRSCHGNGL